MKKKNRKLTPKDLTAMREEMRRGFAVAPKDTLTAINNMNNPNKKITIKNLQKSKELFNREEFPSIVLTDEEIIITTKDLIENIPKQRKSKWQKFKEEYQFPFIWRGFKVKDEDD